MAAVHQANLGYARRRGVGKPLVRGAKSRRFDKWNRTEPSPAELNPTIAAPLPSSRPTGSARTQTRPDVGCLQPLLALLNVEFDFLALGEGPVTGHCWIDEW